MTMISLNNANEEKIALSIIFKEGTLEIVLRGLKILKVLKAAKLVPPTIFPYKADTTIMKSNMFQLFLM